jgi:hypothetical protein
MNTIPHELIALPGYPGYFWHPTQKQLYSIKVSGVLHALAKQPAFRNRGYDIPEGFTVCKNGRTKRFGIEKLSSLVPYDYQIPYETKPCSAR